MHSREAKLSLAKAGFLSTSRDLERDQQAKVLTQAAGAWHILRSQPAGAGLQLTALIAAQQLGLVSGVDLLTTARALLAQPAPTATTAAEAAQYAAGLITLRQAVPALATEATAALDRIAWKTLPLRSGTRRRFPPRRFPSGRRRNSPSQRLDQQIGRASCRERVYSSV